MFRSALPQNSPQTGSRPGLSNPDHVPSLSLRTCPSRAENVEAVIGIGQPMDSFVAHGFTLNPQQKSWPARATDETRVLARAILQKWL